MATKLYDNTRLSSHRNCNRLYYLRHQKHWTPDFKAVALTFGGCWHNAMDVVWGDLHKFPDDTKLANHAFENGFLPEWDEEGLPHHSTEELDLKMRTPENAYQMIYHYIRQRRPFIKSCEILEIELPFAVPIFTDNPDVLYVGRIDKVVEWQGRVWGIEHKTTTSGSARSGFYNSFTNMFSPNSQVDGYLHALHMLYGKKAKGIMIDGALVSNATQEKFMFIPVERQTAMLDAWLFDTHEEIKKIEHNNQLLLQHESDIEEGKQHPFLHAFPKNTNACQHYGSCPMVDICKMVTDPSTHDTPMGYRVEKWEPFKELELDKIGIKPEEE